MGGGGQAAAAPSYPPPVDYSAAMLGQSQDNKTVAMGQIMAMQFSVMQASMNQEMQTAANLEQGLENLDTKLQIAKLNYVQSMQEESDRHEEKMTEIGASVDAARAGTTDTQTTSDFLNTNTGSYQPGSFFNAATSNMNSNKIDFNSQWSTLQQNSAAQDASNAQTIQNHDNQRTTQVGDYYDQQAYQN